MGEDDVVSCAGICTNDYSGISTHVCEDNTITAGASLEMCKWENSSVGGVTKNCNCESVLIPDACPELEVTSPSECGRFKSKKSACFYNKNSYEDGQGVECENVDDVLECSNIKNASVCTYARKIKFPNLDRESSLSHATFLCLWDIEKEGCVSKGLGKPSVINSEDEGSPWLFIVLGMVGGCVIIITVVVLVIIVVFMKRRVRLRKKEFEMSVPLSSVGSESSLHNLPPLSGFFFFFDVLLNIPLILFVPLFPIVKRDPSSREYMIGETIGRFEVMKVIGRGFPFDILRSC
jgi:hypothetical protein